MERILIATDGSPASAVAIQRGLELAQEVGADVIFVHVRPSVPPLFGDPLYQRKLSEQLANARQIVEEAVEEAEAAGVGAETEVLEGDVADVIASVAHARDVDLVVVGSHGRGALARALLGSVSRALVERSPVPLMVVRDRVAARVA